MLENVRCMTILCINNEYALEMLHVLCHKCVLNMLITPVLCMNYGNAMRLWLPYTHPTICCEYAYRVHRCAPWPPASLAKMRHECPINIALWNLCVNAVCIIIRAIDVLPICYQRHLYTRYPYAIHLLWQRMLWMRHQSALLCYQHVILMLSICYAPAIKSLSLCNQCAIYLLPMLYQSATANPLPAKCWQCNINLISMRYLNIASTHCRYRYAIDMHQFCDNMLSMW